MTNFLNARYVIFEIVANFAFCTLIRFPCFYLRLGHFDICYLVFFFKKCRLLLQFLYKIHVFHLYLLISVIVILRKLIAL
jgi:hypothetical protein